ncbi:MAG: Hsp20/alpha crystallin family protein [Nitrosopumilus sp.]|nr:Hsp20/alpha crystallin family protein [Nitrosopumilus sp.]MDH3340762.1 Hsp20/alpha crystallin family protein [Nitrosopumilus sp.]
MWFDEPFEEFRRMSDRFFNTDDIFGNNWSGDRQQTVGPYYYGYTMTVGPDGKPVVKEYGNVRPTSSINSNALTSGTKEPYVDEVLDEENRILKLVAEMPGVEKSDIQVSIQDKSVSIKTGNANRKYEAHVPLKYNVDENSTKAQYKNGILELTFKLAEEKPKGKLVSVE